MLPNARMTKSDLGTSAIVPLHQFGVCLRRSVEFLSNAGVNHKCLPPTKQKGIALMCCEVSLVMGSKRYIFTNSDKQKCRARAIREPPFRIHNYLLPNGSAVPTYPRISVALWPTITWRRCIESWKQEVTISIPCVMFFKMLSVNTSTFQALHILYQPAVSRTALTTGLGDCWCRYPPSLHQAHQLHREFFTTLRHRRSFTGR